MRVLLALLAVAALASAQSTAISISETELTMDEGFSKRIAFELTEPIICPISDFECSVVITLTNSHPDEVELDTCIIKWKATEWEQTRYLRISAVDDFTNDREKEFYVVTEAVISRSEFYTGVNIPDIHIKTRSRPTANCYGTGDPHFSTFDGRPFHIFPAGTSVLYKSNIREFEVQARTHSGRDSNGGVRPAVHCGVAALEDNDLFIIDVCSLRLDVRKRFTSPPGQQPTVTNSGNAYTIKFKSGASVTVRVEYWSTIRMPYLNIWTTAPGRDYSPDGTSTVGLCGNFNGNPYDDLPVQYGGWWYAEVTKLLPEQVPKRDLWTWTPPSVLPTGPVLPPHAESCTYELQRVARPILTAPDVEDITNLIKNAPNDNTDDLFNFDPNNEFELPEVDLPTDEEAMTMCRDTILASHVVSKCLELLPNFVNQTDNFIEDCYEDLRFTGDTDFIGDAIANIEEACAELAFRDQSTWEKDQDGNPINPNNDLSKLCVDNCNNNGNCVNAKCECNDGFIGGLCQYNVNQPPTLISLDVVSCDTTGNIPCDNEISIAAQNVLDSDNLKCRFGDIEVPALHMGSVQVLCARPNIEVTGATEQRVTVQVTNDGVNWSNALEFVYYDAVCQVCNNKGQCSVNPESCTIDGECVFAGHPKEGNTCEVCVPETSVSDWTFSYQNALVCGPRFDLPQGYIAEIVEEEDVGFVLARGTAINPSTATDPNNAVTYTLSSPYTELPYEIVADPENAGGFLVRLTEKIVVAEIEGVNFVAAVTLVATDQAGNQNHATLQIHLQATNRDPIFPSDGYSLTVPEDAAVGTVIGQIEASDPDGTGQWSEIQYSWLLAEQGSNLFAVDADTGVVTVAAPLDYETSSHYLLQLRAMDGGGQSQITDVRIEVTDVDEDPTDITLTANVIAEDSPAGTIVGLLDVVDPELHQTHSFVVNGPFSVDSSNNLVSTEVFDFESFPAGKAMVNITITATTVGGTSSFTKKFTIFVTDVNEAPYDVEVTIAVNGVITLLESEPVDQSIGSISATDDDAGQSVFCNLAAGAGFFTVAANNLVLIKKLDFETQPEFTITVICADNADPALFSEPLTLTVQVQNANDAPEDLELINAVSVPEDAATGFVVGNVVAKDYDELAGDITFTVKDAPFVVEDVNCDPNTEATGTVCTGTMKVFGEGLNFEGQNPLSVVIIAKDNADFESEHTVEVTITDVNDAPSEPVFVQNVVEANAPAGTSVGTLTAVDEDASQTLTVTLTNSAGLFDLKPATDRRRAAGSVASYDVVVADGAVLTVGDKTISVDVSDGQTTSAFDITITVSPEVLRIKLFEQDCTTPLAAPKVTENDASAVVGCLKVTGTSASATFSVSGTQFKLVNGNKLALASAVDFEQTTELSATVSATVAGAAPETQPQATTFTVAVTNVNEAPVFTVASFNGGSVDDNEVGVELGVVKATDPENAVVTYIIANDQLGLIGVGPSNGKVTLRTEPASISGLTFPMTYNFVVRATAGGLSTDLPATVRITDQCDPDPCVGNAQCVDIGNTFRCCLPNDDHPSCQALTSANSTGSNSSASMLPVILGVLAGLIVLALIVLFIVHRRNASKDYHNSGDDLEAQPWAAQAINPTFVNPEGGEFAPGLSNPIYSWYHPDMSRQECSDYLQQQGEGAFVVRDSKATPGWHMLGVKTRNTVVHDKIRMLDDGTYELLPADGSRQPRFGDLPELIQHYADRREGPYHLALDNPLYDNHNLAQNRGQGAVRVARPSAVANNDPNAPLLPLKAKEVDHIAVVADEDDIYTNTEQAREAISSA